MAWYYKEEGDSVIATLKENQEIVYFIPECYFEGKSALVIGNLVNLLGVFNFAIYENDKPKGELKTFNYPTIFTCEPSKIEKAKEVKLTKTSEVQDYRLLKFKNGDKLICQTSVDQNIENVEELFRLFVLVGNLPNTIDYRNVWKIFDDNIRISGNTYGVSMQLLGLLPTEICRDPEDNSKPFRVSKAKKNGEWTNYKPISVKQVPDYISPYVSLTSENYDNSVMMATMMDDGKHSPLERVLTGN